MGDDLILREMSLIEGKALDMGGGVTGRAETHRCRRSQDPEPSTEETPPPLTPKGRNEKGEMWKVGERGKKPTRDSENIKDGPECPRRSEAQEQHRSLGRGPRRRPAALVNNQGSWWVRSGLVCWGSGPAWPELNSFLCVNHRLNHMTLLISDHVLPIKTISYGTTSYLLSS